jgi:hypothetical protein
MVTQEGCVQCTKSLGTTTLLLPSAVKRSSCITRSRIGQLADLRCCTGPSDRDLILLPVGRFSSVAGMYLVRRLSGALRKDPKFDAPCCTEDPECYHEVENMRDFWKAHRIFKVRRIGQHYGCTVVSVTNFEKHLWLSTAGVHGALERVCRFGCTMTYFKLIGDGLAEVQVRESLPGFQSRFSPAHKRPYLLERGGAAAGPHTWPGKMG